MQDPFLPSLTVAAVRDAAENPGRSRLLQGMVLMLSEKSYAATTILDIVRAARVSKRTFYEHFTDKEQCFLATYTMLSKGLLQSIRTAAECHKEVEAQLEAALEAYFVVLEASSSLTRAFLAEVHAAGPAAIRQRRTIHGQFAGLLIQLVTRARVQRPELCPLTPEMATAIVGGINELLLLTLEEGSDGRLTRVRQTASQLIRAAVTPLPDELAPRPERRTRATKSARRNR